MKSSSILDVADLIRGVTYKRDEARPSPAVGLIPVLRANNIHAGHLVLDNLVYVPSERVSRAQRIRQGDIVLAMSSGSRDVVGKAALAMSDWDGGFGAFCGVLRARSGTRPEWLARFMQSPQYRAAIEAAATGTNINNLSKSTLASIEVPSLDEHAQLEAAQSLDRFASSRSSSIAHLASARHAIVRYRQAVLAAACSGRLTADWREANPGVVDVEHALIESTGLRRRRKHEEQRVELDLPAIPESYYVASVGDASVLLEYGTSQRAESHVEHGVPVLRMGNIQDGSLDLRDLKYRTVDAEMERLTLQDGDLLFNRTNSPELVGKAAVFHGNEPMSFASYLIRVRFEPNIADSDFVNYWINSAWGRAWARLAKTDGVSQSNINGSKLSLMPIPLPPIEEQREIVYRASRMLELADGLLGRIDAASRGVDRSSQAVLAKAFRGDLVPAGFQDNADS